MFVPATCSARSAFIRSAWRSKFSGPPKEAQGNARVIEVYLGTEAVTRCNTQAVNECSSSRTPGQLHLMPSPLVGEGDAEISTSIG